MPHPFWMCLQVCASYSCMKECHNNDVVITLFVSLLLLLLRLYGCAATLLIPLVGSLNFLLHAWITLFDSFSLSVCTFFLRCYKAFFTFIQDFIKKTWVSILNRDYYLKVVYIFVIYFQQVISWWRWCCVVIKNVL